MLLKKFFTIIVLLALTSVGSTIPSNITPKSLLETLQDNLPGNISQSCIEALGNTVTDPAFVKCFPIPAFAPLLPMIPNIGNIKNNPKELLQYLDSIDKFSNNICSVHKCADEDVQKAIQAIESGCQVDLNNNNTIAELIYGVFVFYSPLRDSICFKNNDEFCVHETLNITLSLPDSPITITGKPIIDAIAVADPESVCTHCNKDIINTFGNFLKNNTLALQVLAQAGINQKSIDTMKIGIAVKCGIKFEESC